MKRILLSVKLLATGTALALSLPSCVSPYHGPNTKIGGVMGAALGAGTGAVIGEQSDRPLEGAAIGGVIGALTGSTLGSAVDSQYGYYNSPRRYSRPAHYPTHTSYGYSYGAPQTSYYEYRNYGHYPTSRVRYGRRNHCYRPPVCY